MRVVETREIPLAEILVSDYEVRTAEEDPELQALAESIRRDGLLTALGVVKSERGYVLVHGHRRYSACLMARVTPVRCDVLEGDDATMRRASIIENYHRRDVTPLERAAQIADALQRGVMTEEELAETFGRAVEWVREQAAMLDWPSDVAGAVHARQLSVAAARHLARVTDDAYRESLVRYAVEGGCTERTAIAWVAGWRAALPAAEVTAAGAAPAGSSLGAPVPQALCFRCHEAHRPDGMAGVILCPKCLGLVQRPGSGGAVSV